MAASLLMTGIGLSLSYWPGLMTWDSARQYDQALNGGFDDWHPPLMEWLWRQLLVFHSGPSPMLLLQLSLYGAGFVLLISWAMKKGQYGLALALAASALMPLAVALMAEVIKDSLMAGMLLASVGLLVWVRNDRDWPLRIIAIALILFAAALRFNAFLAGAPLLVALLPEALRRTPLRMATAAALAMASLLLAIPVANRLIGAERSGVELSLMIFDLGGITEDSGANVFPPLGIQDPVKVNHQCYSPVKWDTYALWAEELCPIDFANVQTAFQERGQSPTVFWARAVLMHPLAYAEHRFRHWNINTRFLVHDDIERAIQNQSAPNFWHYRVTPNLVLKWVDGAALISADTPLGWPICWLALALGVIIVSYRLPSSRIVIPIALSALLYGLGYAVFSVASELRYYLWTMVATIIAAIITINDVFKSDGKSCKWRYFIAMLPLLVIMTFCIIWRAAPNL
jgi:hypothetical protein